MGALRGVIVGSLGLTLLYDVVAPVNGKNPPGVGALTGIPGKVANFIISPNVPLIPDLRSGSSSGSQVGKKGPDGKTIIAEGTLPDNSIAGQIASGGPLGSLGQVATLIP